MLVYEHQNFQEATIRPIVPKHKHSIVFYCSPLNFLPRAFLIFNFFLDESRQSQM